MTATDVDADALRHAQTVLDSNGLQDHGKGALHLDKRIHLHAAPKSLLAASSCHFTLCNPPFYASPEDRAAASAAKRTAHAVSEAAEAELYTPGGEAAFVSRMVHESLRDEHRAHTAWYTSMLGRLSSVAAIVSLLKKLRISNYGITELVQGKTRRWAIAWSFRGSRLPDSVGCRGGASLRAVLPPSNTRDFLVQPLILPRDLYTRLEQLPSLSDDGVTLSTDVECVRLDFHTPCWTRGARRQRQRGDNALAPRSKDALPVLSVAVSAQGSNITVTWTFGHDRVLFDSFSTHLRGALADCPDGSARERPSQLEGGAENLSQEHSEQDTGDADRLYPKKRQRA